LLRTAEPKPVVARRQMRQEIAEGLRLILGHPLLRATLVSSGVTNFFAAILNSLYVLYAVRELGIGPAGIGGILLVASLGGLGGAVMGGRVVRRLGLGPTMVLGMLLIAGGALIVPLVMGPLTIVIPLLTFGMAVGAAGDSFYNITAMSLRQSLTPDRLQGRVAASGRVVILGAQPLGALLGGVLGEALGLRSALALVAVGFFSSFIWLFLSPVRRLHAQPAPLGAASAEEAMATTAATGVPTQS